MKGVEEFECTAVVVILKFIRNLVACSMDHYPGVSHRTFGFRTLSNDRRHEFDTLAPSLNQIELTKNIRIEKNQMFSLNVSRKASRTRLECFIFERVRLSSVIERSGALYRKTRVKKNRPVETALKHPRRFEVLILSYSAGSQSPDFSLIQTLYLLSVS